MAHFISNDYSTIDLNKVRYDLSLIYAKEKLREALSNGSVPNYAPDIAHPKYLDEAQYLINMFGACFSEYCTTDNDAILKQIDPTYEDWVL